LLSILLNLEWLRVGGKRKKMRESRGMRARRERGAWREAERIFGEDSRERKTILKV